MKVWRVTVDPANVFNGMISPLKNFPLAGVIWYQGESNIGRGAQYKTLLRVLIDDWREQFKDFWLKEISSAC